jgi:hypothetical protein
MFRCGGAVSGVVLKLIQENRLTNVIFLGGAIVRLRRAAGCAQQQQKNCELFHGLMAISTAELSHQQARGGAPAGGLK